MFEQTRIGQLDKGSIKGIGIDVGIALHDAQEVLIGIRVVSIPPTTAPPPAIAPGPAAVVCMTAGARLVPGLRVSVSVSVSVRVIYCCTSYFDHET